MNPCYFIIAGVFLSGSHFSHPYFSQEYIRFRQSQFPSFSVSESRNVHAQALRALCAVRDKFTRLVKRGFNAGPSSLRASVAAVEDTLLSVFFRACNFERQVSELLSVLLCVFVFCHTSRH